MENGVDTLTHGDWTIGSGEEVGQAGNDADVGLWPDLVQALMENSGVATRDHLKEKMNPKKLA